MSFKSLYRQPPRYDSPKYTEYRTRSTHPYGITSDTRVSLQICENILERVILPGVEIVTFKQRTDGRFATVSLHYRVSLDGLRKTIQPAPHVV